MPYPAYKFLPLAFLPDGGYALSGLREALPPALRCGNMRLVHFYGGGAFRLPMANSD